MNEEEIEQLMTQKKLIHEENVELSKAIQTSDELVEQLRKQYDVLDKKYPNNSLDSKSSKLQNEIARLDVEKEEAEKRKNSSQELEEISFAEFRKFADAWKKKMLGREVKLAEQRLKWTNRDKHQR